MFLKIQLVTLNIATSLFLIFFLCLGSQNLKQRFSLDFIVNKTVALPMGFLVGTSFTLGVISGGLTSVLMLDDELKN